MMLFVLSAVAWLLCGVLVGGWWFAHLQRKFPSIRARDFKQDQADALVCYLFGPLALIVFTASTGVRSGWLWPWGAKAKREAGIAA
jgi:hypothetical protein